MATLDGDWTGNSLTGTDGRDLIEGHEGNNTIPGGAGDDTIDCGSQGDTIFGGDGNDVLTGGSGDDQLLGAAGDDAIVITPTEDSRIWTLSIAGGDRDDRMALDRSFSWNDAVTEDQIRTRLVGSDSYKPPPVPACPALPRDRGSPRRRGRAGSTG
ncbi:calcium-binding protein [Rhodovulum sp. BSW8]|uniref:calcium-binding protein n=1 Tax=Rhodovulum sp. BSW8 TaxID=2259645 RepID=UPI001FB2E452|nr:hypothetical protein [Rhodovulum sp. BSW8]